MAEDEVSGGGSNHGWQKVTNPRRARRREVKAANPGKPAGSGESQAFQALEVHAADRRAQRDLILLAAATPALAAAQSDSEDFADAAAAPAPVSGKPAKPKKVKKPKATVAQLAAGIDPSELSIFLDGVTESYPAAPDVQLMRFADYFARVFQSVTTAQFAWHKILSETPLPDVVEIPFSYLAEGVAKIASDWLASRPAEDLSSFMFWLLKAVVSESHAQAKPSESSKVGVLVVLALILRRRPDILLQKASLVLGDSQLQGHDRLPALVWVYGQAARGDLVVGMSLWVHNLLPLAAAKSSPQSTKYITAMFMQRVLLANLKKARAVLLNGVSRKGERLVPPATLDTLLRLAYPPGSGGAMVTEVFRALYPLVRELCLSGSFGTKATKPVAQQLFVLSLSAAASDVEELANEACQNFIWCLQQDPESYNRWEKQHLSNLSASIRILRYLSRNWKENVARLSPLNDLQRTIASFRSMHQKALKTADSEETKRLLKEADSVSKAVAKNAYVVPACVKGLATAAVGVALAYGFYQLSPPVNPWNWDGGLLLSKTHSFF